ncbi:MAG: SDR family oxidoreductase [Fuerstiella sp.]
MRSFAGKQIVLTGAASGIGRALALRLAEEGAALHLVDINQDGLNELAAQIPNAVAAVWQCDLSSATDIDRWLDQLEVFPSPIDGLINNAGVAYYGATDAMTMQQWDWLMNINLSAPIRITQRLLPALMQRPDAHIVNMCSISGLVAGGRFAAYHTSKFGLIGFTEAIRAEFGRKGIGVTAICPGPVQTALYDSAESANTDKAVPNPPAWVCTTAEKVAAKTMNAMRKNKRQVLITPMAHGLFQMKKFVPGLIDFANQFSRKKKRRIKELQLQEEARITSLALSPSQNSKAA